jgi:hypothetical protein
MITGVVMARQTQLTVQQLETQQERLRSCKWTDGESNTESDYSRLSCECALRSWITVQLEYPELGDVAFQATSPDITCVFLFTNGQTLKNKIELKTSLGTLMPGSTIGKLNINQCMIYCLRPNSDTDSFKFRYSQYYNAMGESDTEIFQDRTPRPMINFNKMLESGSTLTYTEKQKDAWIERYASCAHNRIKTGVKVTYSWQDDLVKELKRITITEFIKTTSMEDFAQMKENLMCTSPESAPPS